METGMTSRDRSFLIRGMTAGTIIGLAAGLITALLIIAKRPELCFNFMRF